MNMELLIAIGVVLCLIGGLTATRIWRTRNDAILVRGRLAALFEEAQPTDLSMALEATQPDWLVSFKQRIPILASIERSIDLVGWKISLNRMVATSAVLLVLPAVLVAAVSELPVLPFVAVGALLAFAPYFYLNMLAEKKRNKFIEQLPDAIDMMISVLRSGLSVPQSVKAIGDEMPAPCGPEFFEVLQRINLGQTLPESLMYTAERYSVFELDLIRRATSIQMEVGGSLAELLDKTNSTLRQRIKLKRQVSILTAQSRLSGHVISILPFVLAIAFQILNPGYLRPLYETNVGRLFVVLALVFQFIGMLVIRRLATFRI